MYQIKTGFIVLLVNQPSNTRAGALLKALPCALQQKALHRRGNHERMFYCLTLTLVLQCFQSQIPLHHISMGKLLGSYTVVVLPSPCSCFKQVTRSVEDLAYKRAVHAAGAVSCALHSTH